MMLFRPTPRQVVDDELEFHLEMQRRRYVAEGMEPEAASAAARERFGDVESVRDECHTLANRIEGHVRRAELNRMNWSVLLAEAADDYTAVLVVALILTTVVVHELSVQEAEGAVELRRTTPVAVGCNSECLLEALEVPAYGAVDHAVHGHLGHERTVGPSAGRGEGFWPLRPRARPRAAG